MDIKKMKAYELSGEHLVVCASVDSYEETRELLKWLEEASCGKKVLLICNKDLQIMDEAEMNRLGWYRKDGGHE